MLLPFRIVNVFTVDGAKLSGNPLCVFESAEGLSPEQMQALARQLNLSETAFLHPAQQGGTAKVRIFTPSFEMPFAGHPTLGTASVLGELHHTTSITLETNVGLVEVKSHEAGQWTLRAAKAPTTRPVEATHADIARMVGLTEAAIAGPPLWVDTGVEQLVIPVIHGDLVRAVKPAADRLEQWGYSASRQEAMAYVWAPGDTPGADWTVRFFFTSHGAVVEDPATGSACANLGGWLLATGHELPVAATLRQGESVARPSKLGLRVELDRHIYVTGSVIELGRGTLEL